MKDLQKDPNKIHACNTSLAMWWVHFYADIFEVNHPPDGGLSINPESIRDGENPLFPQYVNRYIQPQRTKIANINLQKKMNQFDRENYWKNICSFNTSCKKR